MTNPTARLGVGEMEWGTAEVVAAASVGVAILAVLVTGIQIIVSAGQANRQRDHDEKMQSKRLAHERQLAHEARAAEAYMKAERVERVMTWDLIEVAANLPNAPIGASVGLVAGPTRNGRWSEMKRTVHEAVDAITEAKAFAWTPQMAEACGLVLVTVHELENRAWATMDRIARDSGDVRTDDLRTTYMDLWFRYDEAIEVYRRTITGADRRPS